ncbi:MAG: type IX secretion system membrane protein PorP/SprF [Siphonobacter sp.]
MIKHLLVSTVLLCGVLAAKAQDPQLSQFYAAPLYLNPAFAGSALAPRATVNYRNQWPALNANYVTSLASFDTYIDKINSGVGLMVMNDAQFSNLRTFDVGLQYAYQLKISEEFRVRAGIQSSFVNRSVNYYNMVFNYEQSGSTVSPVYDDPIVDAGSRINYLDFSGGLLAYSERFWGGLSVHHMNQPNQSFSSYTERLPMKISIQGGFKIPLMGWEFGNGYGKDMDRERSISPAILYKRQGNFDQLDVGAYLTLDPVTIGAWYRGIPIKQYTSGLNNHDALVILVGYRQDNFSIGYSYDATISTLGMATGGAHELSITYTFDQFFDPKPNYRKRKRELACPKF